MHRLNRIGVKISSGLLAFLLILAIATGWLVARGFSQAEQAAVQHSADSLKRQSQAALVQLTSQEAQIYDQELQNAAQVTRIAADYMTRTHDTGQRVDWATVGGVVWKGDQLTRSPDGLLYYDANPNRTIEVLQPGNAPPDAQTDRTLSDSAVLDALFPGLLAEAATGVGIYYQGPQLTFRYYPVRNLPQVEIENGAAQAALEMNLADFPVSPAQNPQRKTVWTPPYADDAGQGMLVSANTPIYFGDEYQGYIGIDISLARLIERLNGLQPTQGSFAFLVDGSGHLIAAPPEGAALLAGRSLTALESSPTGLLGLALGGANPALAPVLEAVKTQQTGSAEINLGGEMRLVTYAPLPDLGWSLAVAAPLKAVVAEAQTVSASIRSDGVVTVRNTLLAMVGLFSLGILASLLFSYRFLQQPLRRLLLGVRAITSGDLSVSVPVTSQDELGELAESFNQMTGELNQRTRQLSQTSAELQVKEAEVRVAALEERQRLARELHDSVSQALYGIALGARTARTQLERDPAKVAEPLDYVLSQAEAGLSEMRALIFELRPESLQNEGLAAALAKQCDALRARYKVEITTELGEEPDLSLDAKEALYRIAQEALHNVARHAGATRVDLRLERAEGEWRLEVSDNGRGFDPGGDYPGHLGLKSMRERAERIGAELRIESRPGAGSSLRVRLPW